MSQKKNVIVVGGGFGGINAVKSLSKNPDLDITLIDRRNHHLFQPLLYQVAMAALSPAEIAVPIRSIFSGYRNVDIVMGNVLGVNFDKKLVQTKFRDFQYDYLVLACGAMNCYFGNVGWEGFAPGLKSLEEAIEIRRRVLTAFEKADREEDPEKQKQLLTFVVVGGGPTGIELAGALGEISRYTLSRDFRHIDSRRTRIILIEAGERILPSFSPELSGKASRGLEKLGVTIWTKTKVTGIDQEGVTLKNERILAKTVLWAAGIGPADLNEKLSVELGSQNRIRVNSDLTIPGQSNVFVIGDQAYFVENGNALPGLAPVAIQQGKFVAKNIFADMKQKPRKPFKYLDKGIMATIGRADAIVQFAGMKLNGFIAWAIWLFVHIFYLIGFRNRMIIIFQWGWSYLTFRRGARIITIRGWKPLLKANARKKSVPSRKKTAAKKK